MIKSLTVTNHLGESMVLELGSPEKSGFSVLSIDGLGPAKADINTSEVSSMDGSLYTSARVNSRNIILNLGLLEVPTIEDSRQKSYKYFPVKKQIKLRIETDNRISETYGYVESNTPNIFSSRVSTQISIICPDPYLYDINDQATVFSGIDPKFSFEFSNESLVTNLLKMGDIINQTMQTVYYTGDADIGMLITIHALDAATNVTIYNVVTHEIMKIDTAKLAAITGSAIIAGDDILISTVKGDKYVKLLREGVYTNILNALDRDANWFQLSTGDNVFAYTAETGASNLQFKIENRVVYEGV